MKESKITLLLFLLFHVLLFSQSHELGIMAGGSNFIGDVGKTQYIAPNSTAFGFVYRLNRSPRHSYRFSIARYNLKGNDSDSNSTRRRLRGLEFNNNVSEVSLGIEYSFWDFNLHESGFKSTPYIHTGIGVINYDKLGVDTNNVISGNGISTTAVLPISLGYKTRIADKLILTFEVSAKYTYSDNLDGSTPIKNGDLNFGGQGGALNNDWYVFSGIMLTYTFGRLPCFCNY